MMFIMPQFKDEGNFKEKDEGTHMKIHFHVVLGKAPEEVWSLIKIKKVISMKKDVVFENTVQNIRYVVARANGNICEFTIADFPLMNLYDLLLVALLLKDKSFSYLQNTEPEEFKLGVAHIKIFIENYYECLALTDVELATTKGMEIKSPMAPSKTQAELKKYVDGEICSKPLGLVFAGKTKLEKRSDFCSRQAKWRDTLHLNIRT